MKFGVREICDVVFRAKTKMQFGNKTYYENEPVFYFDSLKTTSLEGAVTTVYAQGGKGNARLASWDGEKTVTFNMEDALISPVSLSMLANANMIEATESKPIYIHMTQNVKGTISEDNSSISFTLENVPAKPEHSALKDIFYVMLLNSRGEVVSEPFTKGIAVGEKTSNNTCQVTMSLNDGTNITKDQKNDYLVKLKNADDTINILADFYVARTNNVMQIDIEPEQHGGNYYIEASTLFRSTDGEDLPAEFIIPNAKVQSNFTFTMASTGDPSTFNFVMDAFPDYTRHDQNKKVFASIQIIEDASDIETEKVRARTYYPSTSDEYDTDKTTAATEV